MVETEKKTTLWSRIKPFVKVLIVIIPLIIIVRAVDVDVLVEKVKILPWWIVPLLFLIYFFRQALQSFRFVVLVHPFSTKIRFLKLFAIDLKAKYYSIMVPSSFGYDITRGVILKDNLTAKEILATSFMFRLTGTIPFFLLAVVGLIILDVPELQDYRWIVYSSFILLSFLSVFITSNRVQNLLLPLLKYIYNHISKILPEKVKKLVHSTGVAILAYRHHQITTFKGIVLGFAMQMSVIVCCSITMIAVTGNHYFVELLLFIPIIEIICMLVPISPNGYGIRELLLLVLFNYINEGREQLLLYVSLSFIELLVRLLGLAVIIAEKKKSLKL